MKLNKLSLDRELCKKSASAFLEAARLIDNQPEYWEFKEIMIAPYTVDLMMACELYYKYLLIPYIQNISDNRFMTHSILSLHNLLIEVDSKKAEMIEIQYNNEAQNFAFFRPFIEVLKLNDMNFNDFRYLFERNKNKAMYSTYVSMLVRALKKVCDNE